MPFQVPQSLLQLPIFESIHILAPKKLVRMKQMVYVDGKLPLRTLSLFI